MNIKNYLKLIGIDIEIDNIDELVEFLDNNKLNYWNYCIEDKTEIKDIEKTVLVEDKFRNKRYFEIEETQTI